MPGRKKASGRKRRTSTARARKGKGKKSKGSTRPKKAPKKRSSKKRSTSRSRTKKRSPTKKEIKERITLEGQRMREISEKIAQRDGEIQELEKRLNTLMLKYRQGRDRGKEGPSVVIRGNDPIVKPINSTNDKNIQTGVERELEYKRLLELQLEKERAELALLMKVAELKEREKALDEREDSIKEAEEEVEVFLSSEGPSEVINEIKDNLEERLAILEIRDRRLDDIEDELEKLEGLIDDMAKDGKGRPKRGRKGQGADMIDEEE